MPVKLAYQTLNLFGLEVSVNVTRCSLNSLRHSHVCIWITLFLETLQYITTKLGNIPLQFINQSFFARLLFAPLLPVFHIRY